MAAVAVVYTGNYIIVIYGEKTKKNEPHNYISCSRLYGNSCAYCYERKP